MLEDHPDHDTIAVGARPNIQDLVAEHIHGAVDLPWTIPMSKEDIRPMRSQRICEISR